MPGAQQLDANAIARVAYALVLSAYVGVGILWRFVQVSRRLGRPALGMSRGWPHWRTRVVAFGLIGFGTLLFLLVIPFVVTGRLAGWAFPLATGAQRWLMPAGIVISVCGLALMIAAQRQMGIHWRLNVDRDLPGELMRTGLFRFCRHPVYLGAAGMVLGFAVGLLSALSLLMLAAMWTTITLQAREEEAFLIEHFGQPYLEYATRVGRFLPRLGRLQPQHSKRDARF